MISPLPELILLPVVRGALTEDLGRAGDITSQACIAEGTRFACAFVARKPGRISGLDCARLAIQLLDPTARFKVELGDAEDARAGEILARVEGDARAILSAERTALNLLGRMSGIATLTAAYVAAVEGLGASIADTRKTTPGLRALEKYAVRCGDGVNHRFGLDDAMLIKDNHIAAAGGIAQAMKRARALAGHLTKIEIEVDRLDQLDEALTHGPDVILLDNFSLADMREAVRRAQGQAVLEASGGVSLETVRAIAETGVDVISVGALTHSAPSLDLGLDAA